MIDLKSLSLDALLERLHSSLSVVKDTISSELLKDEQVLKELKDVRGELRTRIERGDEKVDIEKLSKALSIMSKQNVLLRVTEEEMSDWLALVEAIENHLAKGVGTYGKETKVEIEEANRLLKKIKEDLRKA